MISDYVKGKKKMDYPAEIRMGIDLHRDIDRFTDLHEATRTAKDIFRPDYRLYSGAIVDVIYDHFLAADEKVFSGSSLLTFTVQTYNRLDAYMGWFPDRFAMMYPYMKKQNWLLHYRTHQGTEKSLGGLARRAAYMPDPGKAFRLFRDHYQLLQDCYRHFWAAMHPFAAERFNALRPGDR